MNDQQWFNRVALLAVTIVVLAGAFALVAGNRSGNASANAPAPASAGVDYLYLTIAFNPVSGMDEYFPANLSVLAHTPVVVTITNFDNGTNLVPAAYQQVVGTLGGTAAVWADQSAGPQTIRSVPGSDVAHTFTIAQSPYTINVPIPPAGPTGLPTTVVFTLELNQTGGFVWNCMAPCDDGSMAALGLMAGTVSVES